MYLHLMDKCPNLDEKASPTSKSRRRLVRICASIFFLSVVIPFFLLALVAFPVSAYSQDTEKKTPPTDEQTSVRRLTLEQLQARLKQMETAKEFDEPIKKAITDNLQQAVTQLKLAEDWTARGEQFRSEQESAQPRLKEAKQALATPLVEPNWEDLEKLPLKELEQRLLQAAEELTNAQKQFRDFDDRIKRRGARKLEMPKVESAAKQRLDEVATQLSAKPPADQNAEVGRSITSLLYARKRAADAELDSYQKELASYGATEELLSVQRDLYSRKATQLEKTNKHMQEVVGNRRRVEAERAANQARQNARQAVPAVRSIAEENETLANEHAKLTSQLSAISGKPEDISQRAARLKESRKIIVEKIKTTHAMEVVGPFLLKQLSELPRPAVLERELRGGQEEIARSQLRWLECLEQRANLVNIDAVARERFEQIIGTKDEETRKYLEDELRKLLVEKRAYLDSLISDYDRYVVQLNSQNIETAKLIEEAKSYRALIDVNILWIRSAESCFSEKFFDDVIGAFRWFISVDRWTGIGPTLRRSPSRIVTVVSCLALFLLHLPLRRHMRLQLKKLGERVNKDYTRTMRETWLALFWTVMLALPGPLISFIIGLEFASSVDAPDLVIALGYGLQVTAFSFLLLEICRQACRTDGIAESHFRWRNVVLSRLRRNMHFLCIAGLPILFFVATAEYLENDQVKHSLARVTFCAGMLLLYLVTYRVLRFNSPVVNHILDRYRGTWVERIRKLWTLALLAMPLVLLVLAVVGYYYTAVHLATRLEMSIALIAYLFFFNELLLRWIFAARGRLAKDQADKQKAAAVEQNVSAPPVPQAPQIDLSLINAQTRRLLNSLTATILIFGTWFVWSDVLPAFGILRNVEIYSWTEAAVEQVQSPSGAAKPPTAPRQDGTSEQIQDPSGTYKPHSVQRQMRVTLADLVLATVVIIFMLILANNIPGLMEIAVLQYLPVETGAKYAISTLARYLIIGIGIVLVFVILGVRWASVQWLVAAVSVGLGFGLQEIFANFVSGLILLFERPIRVGDVVTIGEITGTVSRIRMRATTLTNGDCQELVIPNKDLITGRLLNWTLSDSINRLEIRVGLTSGSDSDKAREIMLQTARANAYVLNDPPPHAVFDGFRDGMPSMVLRCYLPNLENRLEALHTLHTAIDRAFTAAGIKLAAPQHDLHFRSVDPSVFQSAKTLISQKEPNA